MAAEAREERKFEAFRWLRFIKGLDAIARSLRLNPDERDAYEDAVRTLVELHEMGVQRAQNEKEHDRSSCLLLRWRARLAELLLLRGKTTAAEATRLKLCRAPGSVACEGREPLCTVGMLRASMGTSVRGADGWAADHE